MTATGKVQTGGWPESRLALRLAIATVWLVFGLGFKVLDLVPRHRRIVAAILGEEMAGPATVLVGLGEVAIALWVLVGWRPILCAALQTVAIAAMNTLELLLARELLLWPLGMVVLNGGFLTLVWANAVRTARLAAGGRRA